MQNTDQVYVWDPFVRFCHWAMVVLFFLAYLTGDSRGSLHRHAGQLILVLVALRVFWGCVGTRHARFSDFCCSPGKAVGYLRQLLTGRPPSYTGHNPAAAWMIVFLLAGSVFLCFSGYAAMAEKGGGPGWQKGGVNVLQFVPPAFAGDGGGHRREQRRNRRWERPDGDGGDLWQDIHEGSARAVLSLIVLHVAGVAASSMVHRENLVLAMVTGRKSAGRKN
ncbi:MAG: cytochrome B [Desulfobulbaceae bacterium]|nr:MAG: cytochrome B [Desulfobulbaceae bacterium]